MRERERGHPLKNQRKKRRRRKNSEQKGSFVSKAAFLSDVQESCVQVQSLRERVKMNGRGQEKKKRLVRRVRMHAGLCEMKRNVTDEEKRKMRFIPAHPPAHLLSRGC